MKKQMDLSILSSIFPDGLLILFDIVDFKLGDFQIRKDCFYNYLEPAEKVFF